ncbi:MAG: hypothetical protein ACYDDZ_10330 [Acidimicrobiales bacterium]
MTTTSVEATTAGSVPVAARLARRPHPRGPLHRLVRRSTWPAWANLIAVLGVTLVALSQLHPSLLLANTTTTGGDTGAHVMLPAFLKSQLLTHGRLTGWDPAWYDGFPVYTFYFPLPGLIVVIFSLLAPYNVAFKLVTVLGTLTLPVSAWAFGRLVRLRDPLPACLAAAMLPFLFEPSFSIYGGNILSTLAGEFSFSLSLSISLVCLGVIERGLRTGRHRVLAGVLFALTLLSHLLPAMFVIAGALVWLLLDADLVRAFRKGFAGHMARIRWRRRVAWSAVAGAIAAGLTAWWLLPFAAFQSYTTNMGYSNVSGFLHVLFPASARWVLVADAIGLVAMVVRRNRVGLFISLMGGLSAGALCLDPVNKLYNARFLPLWFVCLYLMAGYALGETVSGLARWQRRRRLELWVLAVRDRLSRVNPSSWRPGGRVTRYRRPVPAGVAAGSVVGPLVALAAACLAVVPPFVLSASALHDLGVTPGANQPSAWAAWNYSGYQRKPSYPEYRAVISTMAAVGRAHGCGRAMWEYNPALNRFGTTMSLMLLPYWTNGCIDSMEGLLFESSSTTPFHFINQDELSLDPSMAITSPAITYGGLDVPLGVEHLQQLGVRYFMASSPSVEQAANADPNLVQVASTGPWRTTYNGAPLSTTWKVYEVKQSAIVVPLTHRPVVWQGIGQSQSAWLGPAVQWYDHPSRWDVVPSTGGPRLWDRVPIGDPRPPSVPEPTTTVSGIDQKTGSVTFHVARTGVPVEVKVSYFPDWHARGAEGPWRVAPNLMVVVPTSHDVSLTYGTSPSEVAGQILTAGAVVVGSLICAIEWRRRRRSRRRQRALPGHGSS